jgi:hypothetical protein
MIVYVEMVKIWKEAVSAVLFFSSLLIHFCGMKCWLSKRDVKELMLIQYRWEGGGFQNHISKVVGIASAFI